ncbi:MAG TPA: hypothetical protein VJ608_12810 [Albitalea sp.]|nr:hypothetical protein [Albitalea sp.]
MSRDQQEQFIASRILMLILTQSDPKFEPAQRLARDLTAEFEREREIHGEVRVA